MMGGLSHGDVNQTTIILNTLRLYYKFGFIADLLNLHECRGANAGYPFDRSPYGKYSFMNMFTGDLKPAILEALAYSDIFGYPLRLKELHRYLPVRADVGQLPVVLESLRGQVGAKDDFYFLAGREEIVGIRKQRETNSQKLMPRALAYGRILGLLPFVRMVALTGSLAVLNISKNADFDYMLVTVPGRVWMARAFAVLFNRFVRVFGHTLCPNLIVSENALEWPLHDLYSARELCQMIPITGLGVYQKLLKANEWVWDFLPNALLESNSLLLEDLQKQASAFQSFLELPLRGRLGDRFEQWEMNRKITRFSKQEGFGTETVFNADVCQGNFHHHRKWTRDVFEEKLKVIASGAERHEAIPSHVSEIASSPIGSSQ
jgi:hypothetical protein